MVLNIFNLLGIVGLLSIIVGIILSSSRRLDKRKESYIIFTVGGIFLLVYSLYIRDLIFIVLEVVYIIVTLYEFIQFNRK